MFKYPEIEMRVDEPYGKKGHVTAEWTDVIVRKAFRGQVRQNTVGMYFEKKEAKLSLLANNMIL